MAEVIAVRRRKPKVNTGPVLQGVQKYVWDVSKDLKDEEMPRIKSL